MVAVLVSIVILSFGIYIISDYMNRIYQNERQAYVIKKLEILKQSMAGFLRNDASWQTTISSSENNAAGFQCLATNSCVGGRRSFVLLDASGQQLSNSSSPSFGMDLNGNPCSQFNKTKPDLVCVARFDYEWEPDCPVSTCLKQAPRIFGKLSFAFPIAVSVNTRNFDIDFARGKEVGTVGETCASMKGRLNASGKCELPLAGVPCGTAKSMNGLDQQGSIFCEDSPGYGHLTCPTGQLPVGMNSSGQIVCAQAGNNPNGN